MRVQLRSFNDYPGSTLIVTPPPRPPGPVAPVILCGRRVARCDFNEGPFGAGGFANQHLSRFSTPPAATDYRRTARAAPPACRPTLRHRL